MSADSTDESWRMLMDETALLSLAGEIYDTALDPTRWFDVLRSVGAAVGGEKMAIVSVDRRNARVGIEHYVEWDPAVLATYPTYADHDLLRIDAARYPVGTIYHDQMFADQAGLRKSLIYNEWMQPNGALHGMGCVVQADDNLLATLSFYRPVRRGPYDAAETSLIDRLVPHILRAVQMRRQFAALAGERQSVAEALDRLSPGVIVVDGMARVLALNQAAEALLEARDGLLPTRTGAPLSGQNLADIQRLQKLIAEAAGSVQDLDKAPGGILRLSRPSGKRALEVLVAPLPQHELGFSLSGGLAILFINDPEQRNETSSAVLRQLYGFSAAEAEVVRSLLGGRPVGAIAEDLAFSENTVRTLVRRAMRKAGAKTQIELVSQVLGSLGPMRHAK